MTSAWPWPIKPLYWVYFLLDWLDDGGAPDHGKVAVDIVIYAALVFHYVGHALGIGTLLALVSAAFGARVWIAFLKARTVTYSETRQVRDAEQGIDPAP